MDLETTCPYLPEKERLVAFSLKTLPGFDPPWNIGVILASPCNYHTIAFPWLGLSC